MFKEQLPTKEIRAKIDQLYGNYPNGLMAKIQNTRVPQRIIG